MSSLPIRERVPDRYCRHPQTAAILEALEKQSSISAAQIDHLLKQFFVETATWSLYLWERKYSCVACWPGAAMTKCKKNRMIMFLQIRFQKM